MTVSTTQSRIGYNGNGATTVFAFPYRFLEQSDLTVTLVRADTTQVVQTLNTDYTVTGAGDDAGGTVTMAVAPATGQQLIIVRAVPLTQETDYISGDPFPAESHERALDKLTMISQRLENLISRSVRLSDADLLVSSTILPSPIANASLVWNGTGTAIVNGVGAGEFVGLSPYMEVVLGSVDAAEARTNLGVASAASSTSAGIVELATDAEAQTGTDTTRAITPANLAAVTATETRAGVVELATTSEAVTGTDTARAVTPAGVASVLSNLVSYDLGADIATTSGNSQQKLGVPATALWIEIDIVGVSTTGTDPFGFQVGNSGGWTTSGYTGSHSQGATATAMSVAFTVVESTAAGSTWTGFARLSRVRAADTTWVFTSFVSRTDSSSTVRIATGQVTISDLDRVRIAMISGASTFDAGFFRVKAGI